MDKYVEYSSQSWLSRLGGSLKNIFGGIVLLLVSIIILWWNEGRAVKTARGLEEGADLVVNLDKPTLEDSNNEKLIHVQGDVVSDEKLQDDEFNIATNGLRLKRTVEMYQWKENSKSETKKKVGGGQETITEYTYEKVWSNELINSNKFSKKNGHQNPSSIPYDNFEINASNVYLGDFKISDEILNKLSDYENLSITGKQSTSFDIIKETEDNHQVDKLFKGTGTKSNPDIGDIKVSFYHIPSNTYSIIGQQKEHSITPYLTESNTEILMVSEGNVNAKQMFQNAMESNSVMTWILRFLGFLIMFVSFIAMGSFLPTVADVIPFIGSIVGLGVKIFSGVVSFLLSFVIIGIAWIYYRPILGGILIVTGLAVGLFFYKRSLNSRSV
ncbi:MAG: TMEM43 family protein [Flavobacteriales bacterium]|nr:TMEM43 family protein [Flavobacteriales bacterium]